MRLVSGDGVELTSTDARFNDAADTITTAGGTATVLPLDIADPASISAAGDAVAALGGVDTLVNNAAINYDTWQGAVDADLVEVGVTLETNLFGTWQLTSALAPHLRSSPHGRIVNVSSVSGYRVQVPTGHYSIAKAGVMIRQNLNGTAINAASAISPRSAATWATVRPAASRVEITGTGARTDSTSERSTTRRHTEPSRVDTTVRGVKVAANHSVGDFRLNAMPGRHPVDHPLHLAAFRVGAKRRRIITAVQFNDLALVVFDNLVTADDIGVTQPDFTAGNQALEFVRRLLPKVALVDIDFPAERQGPRTQ